MLGARRANRVLGAVACAVLSAVPFGANQVHVRHYPLGTADPASQLRRTPIFRNLPLCSGGLRPPDRRSEINATKESCSGAVPSSESGVRRGERLYNIRLGRSESKPCILSFCDTRRESHCAKYLIAYRSCAESML